MNRPALLAREVLPAAGRQQRSLDKRERLKAAALARFREVGYEQASIDDIARAAHVAVGGFYRHFRSKRQLLLVLVDDLLRELEGVNLRPDSHAPPRAALRALLDRAFSADLRYVGAYRAWEEAARSDPALAKLQRDVRAWTASRVAGVFTTLQRWPGARRNVDIPGLAAVMNSLFWNMLADAQTNPASLRRSIDAATHLMLHALFTDRRGLSTRG